MRAESSPIAMTEVVFSEVQVEKCGHKGKFVSLQVNLYFVMDKLLWHVPVGTVYFNSECCRKKIQFNNKTAS